MESHKRVKQVLVKSEHRSTFYLNTEAFIDVLLRVKFKMRGIGKQLFRF